MSLFGLYWYCIPVYVSICVFVCMHVHTHVLAYLLNFKIKSSNISVLVETLESGSQQNRELSVGDLGS